MLYLYIQHLISLRKTEQIKYIKIKVIDIVLIATVLWK